MESCIDCPERTVSNLDSRPSKNLMPSTPPNSGQITPPRTPDNGKLDGNMQSSEWDPLDGESVLTWHGSYKINGEIGSGAWSKVYAATESSSLGSTQVTHTPPASPRQIPPENDLPNHLTAKVNWTGRQPKKGSLLAIKSSAHKMAGPILLHEARILSYLARQPDSSNNMVEFYGENPKDKSLVFGRADKTFLDIIRASLKNKPESLAKEDPITTKQFWLASTKQLISALAWIHSHNIVHADIKPANILSLPGNQLVFGDFSSSFHLSADGTYEPRPTDAITTQYASPELLKSYSLSRPITDTAPRHPTFASDVWALACTLLVAATGHEPYAFAGHEMRRLAMAKDGSVIASYLNADDWRVGLRVKHGGIVERLVRPALVKLVEKRVDCVAWGRIVEDLAGES